MFINLVVVKWWTRKPGHFYGTQTISRKQINYGRFSIELKNKSRKEKYLCISKYNLFLAHSVGIWRADLLLSHMWSSWWWQPYDRLWGWMWWVVSLVSDRYIDPMHKWQQFKYSFVYIQISPTSLVLSDIFFWKFNSRMRLVSLISM